MYRRIGKRLTFQCGGERLCNEPIERLHWRLVNDCRHIFEVTNKIEFVLFYQKTFYTSKTLDWLIIIFLPENAIIYIIMSNPGNGSAIF